MVQDTDEDQPCRIAVDEWETVMGYFYYHF
jgi:hypothetical protein